MYFTLWIFFVYSFFGWCVEVGYAALVTGGFVNRGFLNGPVCPIYGFGVVIALGCLLPLQSNLVALYLGSVFLTSLLEWLTGFALEKLFHQRWWDYSDRPFNLGGYICLRFSAAWGLACLFVIKVLHPSILFLIRWLSQGLGWGLLALLGAVMTLDLTATLRTISHMNRRLQRIDELAGCIRELSDELGEDLAERVLEAAEKGQDWKKVLDERREAFTAELEEQRERMDDLRNSMAQHRAILLAQRESRHTALHNHLAEWKALLTEETFGQRRILRAFPRLRSLDHTSALERLRRRMDRR
ncbi:MAG: hypothetical protein HFF50_00455 [Lawsonibacter sp.]|nr:hypothetical protein [Lawsonibacter sp.]